MTEDERQLANEYQRNVRKKLPSTREQKRAWSIRVAEMELAKRDRDPAAYEIAQAKRRKNAHKNGAHGNRERRLHRKRRAILDAIKVHAGCADCKRTDLRPECLDFDHLPGTEKRWSVGVNMRRSGAALLDEIAKCEIVCANCHRTRTLERKRAKGLLETKPSEQVRFDHRGIGVDFYQMAVERGLLPPKH